MDDLKTETFGFRTTPDLAGRIKRNAKTLAGSNSVFIERCLEEICEMIDNPEKNDLPEIVAMLRFANAYKQRPEKLNTKPRKTA